MSEPTTTLFDEIVAPGALEPPSAPEPVSRAQVREVVALMLIAIGCLLVVAACTLVDWRLGVGCAGAFLVALGFALAAERDHN